MKLTKDYFTQADLLTAENNIKKKIIEYISKNNLIIGLHSYNNSSISITQPSNQNNYLKLIANYKNFIMNEYSIRSSEKGDLPSHKLHITLGPNTTNTDFYIDIFRDLSEKEQQIMVKTIFHDFLGNNSFFSQLNKRLTTDEYWFHLRNIIPFGPTSKSVNDARSILSSLQNRTIDTKDKVYSLLYTVQHYKQICKRPDVQTGLIKIITSRVDEKFIPDIESFLKIKIDHHHEPINFFDNPNTIVSLIINKENLFKGVSFEHVPQARVDNYNKYFQQINDFLIGPQAKEKLNIDFIDFMELSSKKNPARVYVHSNKSGFQHDIKEIYLHLINTCSHKLLDSYKQEALVESLEKSLNFYLLNKNIHKKDGEDTVYKPKTKKI